MRDRNCQAGLQVATRSGGGINTVAEREERAEAIDEPSSDLSIGTGRDFAEYTRVTSGPRQCRWSYCFGIQRRWISYDRHLPVAHHAAPVRLAGVW